MTTVFLVGFMGSGKSSVGRELARLAGGAFVDLDDRLEARFGRPIREVFEQRGEEVFRRAELEELERVVREAPEVVATGGGTYCDPAARELIRASGGLAVYLEVDWEELVDRIGRLDPSRPMWRDPESARRLFDQRRPHYRRADLTLPWRSSDTAASLAGRLASRLEEVRCGT